VLWAVGCGLCDGLCCRIPDHTKSVVEEDCPPPVLFYSTTGLTLWRADKHQRQTGDNEGTWPSSWSVPMSSDHRKSSGKFVSTAPEVVKIHPGLGSPHL